MCYITRPRSLRAFSFNGRCAPWFQRGFQLLVSVGDCVPWFQRSLTAAGSNPSTQRHLLPPLPTGRSLRPLVHRRGQGRMALGQRYLQHPKTRFAQSLARYHHHTIGSRTAQTGRAEAANKDWHPILREGRAALLARLAHADGLHLHWTVGKQLRGVADDGLAFLTF